MDMLTVFTEKICNEHHPDINCEGAVHIPIKNSCQDTLLREKAR